MNALLLLTADHNRVRGLFARFHAVRGADDVDQMHLLASQIVQELQVHTAIEEEIFYPAVSELSDEIREAVAEGIEEHHVVDQLMAEIRGLEPTDEQWVAKMTVLIENVEHHAEEEENEMFPDIRSEAADGFLEGLAEQLEDRKRLLGAPTLADKIDLTKAELEEKAREQQIPGRSTMSQEELAATVAP